MDTTSTNIGACPYCSSFGQYIYHSGICPKIESIELWPDGTTKRIIFREARAALESTPPQEGK